MRALAAWVMVMLVVATGCEENTAPEVVVDDLDRPEPERSTPQEPELPVSDPASTAIAAASWEIFSGVTEGGRSFAVASTGSCDASDFAREGNALGDRARIHPVDAMRKPPQLTLFSEDGTCTVSSGSDFLLVISGGTHRETRNCPLVFELLGCASPGADAYRLLAVEGAHSVRWVAAMSASREGFGWRDPRGSAGFAAFGITSPWPAGATDISAWQYDFGNGVRAVTTDARLPGGGSGRMVLVTENGELRWRERDPGDLDAYVSIDDIGFLLFTEEWGSWRLRAVHTGESWSGDWPLALSEDYGD